MFFFVQGIFMYIDNQQYFGHLVNSENFETTHKHSDLFSLQDNKYVSLYFLSWCVRLFL